MPSDSLKKSLMEAAKTYHKALAGSPAQEYLEQRGLPPDKISRFRLGYVAEPSDDHQAFRGRLAVPYWRRTARGEWSVIGMKFRAIRSEDEHTKYLNIKGVETELFNTPEMLTNTEIIAICEGELDVVAASSHGIPAVGVPGVSSWKPHYWPLFAGYKTVYIFGDGDNAGRSFSKNIYDILVERSIHVKVVDMEEGHDVNSFIQAYGVDSIKERMR